MKCKFVLLSAAALFFAPAAHAANPIDDFELNGSTANSAGGGATLSYNSSLATLGTAGITFAANGGPTVSGLPSLSAWTIDTVFSFDALGGYHKIVDFSGLVSDSGVYTLGSSLNLYPLGGDGTIDFINGTLARLTVSRTAGGALTGWVNGTQVFTTTDPSGMFDISSALGLNFFQDDAATNHNEAGSGFVDYLRIYDTALSPADASGSGVSSGVPEPATWAMLLFGFGLIGGVMRKSGQRQAIRYNFG
jgi:hypothetical protein